MKREVLSGDGYRLELEYQPPLLTVRLQGDADTTLELTREYWLRISERANAYGAEQLLVLDALPGEVMSDEDLVRFFDSVGTLGLEHVRVAYVEGRLDQVSRIEYVELLALERGYRIRMFGNESDARLWLRYGGG